jgi:cellobiose epimerase
MTVNKKNTLIRIARWVTMLACSLLFFVMSIGCKNDQTVFGTIQKDKDSITTELKKVLADEFKLWYPSMIDNEYGGYYSDADYKWELKGKQFKMIVTQARGVWSNGNAAQFYSDKAPYIKNAKHGFEFLKNFMWDKEFGGFYDLVDRKGEPIKEGDQIIKKAYGNAFAIYGMAAYYKASGDTAALNLAKKEFRWLEKYSYDPKNGGYFQFLSREGKPFTEGYHGTPPKDQNTMIHVMEAFAELYKVWPDNLLKERLTSVLQIIRDTITTDKGYMNLFFNKEWVPVSYRDSSEAAQKKGIMFDHVSFGHDIETAYLLLEASEVLGIKDDSVTLRIAKKMVDHSIKFGMDKEKGGIYDGGYYYKGQNEPKTILNTKEWWGQIEGLNSMLIMADLFPNDPMNYYEKFCSQWQYIKQYCLDPKYGGWYRDGIDTAPWVKNQSKADVWKCNYHTSRGLINIIRRLESGK